MPSFQNLRTTPQGPWDSSCARCQDERVPVAKSIYAIGGMGLGSCLLLSLMMQHLLKTRQVHDRSPLVGEVEELLRGRLCGRVALDTQVIGGQVVSTLRLKLLAGLQKRRQIESIGPFLWQRLAIEPSQPALLRFLVSDDGGGPIEQIDLQRPRVVMPRGKPNPGGTAPRPAPPTGR